MVPSFRSRLDSTNDNTGRFFCFFWSARQSANMLLFNECLLTRIQSRDQPLKSNCTELPRITLPIAVQFVYCHTHYGRLHQGRWNRYGATAMLLQRKANILQHFLSEECVCSGGCECRQVLLSPDIFSTHKF